MNPSVPSSDQVAEVALFLKIHQQADTFSARHHWDQISSEVVRHRMRHNGPLLARPGPLLIPLFGALASRSSYTSDTIGYNAQLY